MSEEIVDSVDTEVVVDAAVEVVDAPVQGEEALGDPGKKALDAMKAQRKAADARAKAAEERAAAAEAKLEGREAEFAAEQEQKRMTAEALAGANRRILSAELRAAAKGKLADPSDAALYINLDEFEVSEDGEVDSDALASAIDDLLARKSHLAADSRRFDGAADQGAKGEPRQSQLSATDLETMSAAEINQARRDGRLNKVLGINP